MEERVPWLCEIFASPSLSSSSISFLLSERSNLDFFVSLSHEPPHHKKGLACFIQHGPLFFDLFSRVRARVTCGYASQGALLIGACELCFRHYKVHIRGET